MNNNNKFQRNSRRAHFPHQRAKAGSGHPQASKVVEGIIQVKGRFGFVLSEKENVPDLLIQGPSLKLALDGDRVRARLLSSSQDGRPTGEITAVLERAKKTAVGQFHRMNGVPYLVPEAKDFKVRLKNSHSFTPSDGDYVVAEITKWPSETQGAEGNLIEVLGPQGPGVDLLAVIRLHELPDVFPPAVSAEATAFGDEVSSQDLQGRRLFFDETVITIDGADAADFDDAVSIRPSSGGGWTLAVHIADVSHYVKEDSPLDQEAFTRGTSVYFPGRVIPMLPVSLSNNLCSLRPGVVRLTLSCVMEINPEGEVCSCEVVESAIRSARRFTYAEVEAVLKGQPVEEVSEKLAADVRGMDQLARLVRKRRMERGSLDFDFPEPHITMDPHGRPVDIQKRERLESHRLIEDFMLLANESVARFMSQGPFIYRIHESPDKVKFEKLKKTLDAVGFSLPYGADPTSPKTFQRVIGLTGDQPVQPIVQMMILRSLHQAVYTPVNKGHFGLASPCYTHFTSPIRRYPDLIVHRLVRERLRKRLTAERVEHWHKILPRIASHASKRERIAVKAERDYTDLQKVLLMKNRIGDSFSGAITGIAAFGFFVQLADVFVEGMVPIGTLDDYYVHDEVRMRLIGKRTGRKLWIGQKVDIRLADANPVKRQLEFQLLQAEGHSGQSGAARKTSHSLATARNRSGTPGRRKSFHRRPHRNKKATPKK